MVSIRMGCHDMVNVWVNEQRAAIVLANVRYDRRPGILKAAIDDMDVAHTAQLVSERDCITTLACFDVQEVDLEEVSHMSSTREFSWC